MKKLFSLVLSLCILAGCLCLPMSAFAAAPALSSLEISADGVTYESVEDFNAETLTYYYKCRGEVLPTVRATAAAGATVTVHQAGKYYRTAEIVVSAGGQETTYQVVFLQNLSHLAGATATSNLGYQSNPASNAIDGVYTASSSWLYSTTATEKGVFNLDLGAVYDVYDISIVYNYNVGNDHENHDIIYSSTTGTEDADYGDPIGVTSKNMGDFNEVADAENVDWFDLTLDKAIPFQARYFKLSGSAGRGAIGYSEVEVWGLTQQYPTAIENIRISEDGGATYTSFADYNPATNTYYYKCGRTADDSGNILPLVQAIAADGTTATVLQASEGIRNAKITVTRGDSSATYTMYFLVNLSRESGVKFKASASYSGATNAPAKAIDGDIASYWSHGKTSGPQQSFYLDLGATYQVYEVTSWQQQGHSAGSGSTKGQTNCDLLYVKTTEVIDASDALVDSDWVQPTATFAYNGDCVYNNTTTNFAEFNHTFSYFTTLRSIKISGSATTGARGIRELQIWGLPAQAAGNDAGLSSISLSTNGRTYTNIADFDSEKEAYVYYCQDASSFGSAGVTLPIWSVLPSVKVETSHRDATVTITQATASDATATIRVTAPDGVTQKTYKVYMVSNVSQQATVSEGGTCWGSTLPTNAIDGVASKLWQPKNPANGGQTIAFNFTSAKTIAGFDVLTNSNNDDITHWNNVQISTDGSLFTTLDGVTGSVSSHQSNSTYYWVKIRFATPVSAKSIKISPSSTASIRMNGYEFLLWGAEGNNAIYQNENGFNASLKWASSTSQTGTLYWAWYDSQGELLKIGKTASPVTGTGINAIVGAAPSGANMLRFFFFNSDVQPLTDDLRIGL